MTLSIFPAAVTWTHSRHEKGPRKESADQGIFFGLGGMSVCSTGIVPSGGGVTFRLSYQPLSEPHSNGAGICVVGVIGLSVSCSTLGGRTSTARSTRTLAHVSTGCPPFLAGSKVQRSRDLFESCASEGIGSRTRRAPLTRP